MGEIQAIVCVHFDERGEIDYRVFGGEEVRLFIVDDRAPHDRVYEWTRRDDPAAFRELVPEGAEIGHSGDERHEAIAARIDAFTSGKPHLSVVPTPHDGGQ